MPTPLTTNDLFNPRNYVDEAGQIQATLFSNVEAISVEAFVSHSFDLIEGSEGQALGLKLLTIHPAQLAADIYPQYEDDLDNDNNPELAFFETALGQHGFIYYHANGDHLRITRLGIQNFAGGVTNTNVIVAGLAELLHVDPANIPPPVNDVPQSSVALRFQFDFAERKALHDADQVKFGRENALDELEYLFKHLDLNNFGHKMTMKFCLADIREGIAAGKSEYQAFLNIPHNRAVYLSYQALVEGKMEDAYQVLARLDVDNGHRQLLTTLLDPASMALGVKDPQHLRADQTDTAIWIHTYSQLALHLILVPIDLPEQKAVEEQAYEFLNHTFSPESQGISDVELRRILNTEDNLAHVKNFIALLDNPLREAELNVLLYLFLNNKVPARLLSNGINAEPSSPHPTTDNLYPTYFKQLATYNLDLLNTVFGNVMDRILEILPFDANPIAQHFKYLLQNVAGARGPHWAQYYWNQTLAWVKERWKVSTYNVTIKFMPTLTQIGSILEQLTRLYDQRIYQPITMISVPQLVSPRIVAEAEYPHDLSAQFLQSQGMNTADITELGLQLNWHGLSGNIFTDDNTRLALKRSISGRPAMTVFIHSRRYEMPAIPQRTGSHVVVKELNKLDTARDAIFDNLSRGK